MLDRAPPSLTDEEIFQICRPRRQGAAQIRCIKSLGLPVKRRAEGTPLVWRADVKRRPAAPAAAGILAAVNEPKWSRKA